MIIIAAFVLLVFLYSLVSERLERTVFTAPIVFTATGVLLIFALPVLGELEADRKAFLLLAEIGLVLTLFVDAARINLQHQGVAHGNRLSGTLKVYKNANRYAPYCGRILGVKLSGAQGTIEDCHFVNSSVEILR